MGNSTKTITNLQVQGLMDEYGGLRESLFRKDVSYIGNGMDAVIQARKKTLIDIKSLYNSGYMKAMGYTSKLTGGGIENLDMDIVYDYIRDNIDNGIYEIISAVQGVPTIKDNVEIYVLNSFQAFDLDTYHYIDRVKKYDPQTESYIEKDVEYVFVDYYIDTNTGHIVLTCYEVPTLEFIDTKLKFKYDVYEVTDIPVTVDYYGIWDIDIVYERYTVTIKTITVTTVTDDDGNKTSETSTSDGGTQIVTAMTAVVLKNSSTTDGDTTVDVIDVIDKIEIETNVHYTESIYTSKREYYQSSSELGMVSAIKSHFEGTQTREIDVWALKAMFPVGTSNLAKLMPTDTFASSGVPEDIVSKMVKGLEKNSNWVHYPTAKYNVTVKISGDGTTGGVYVNVTDVTFHDSELQDVPLKGGGSIIDYVANIIRKEVKDYIVNNDNVVVRYKSHYGGYKLLSLSMSSLPSEAVVYTPISMMPNIPIKKGGAFIDNGNISTVLRKIGLDYASLSGDRLQVTTTKEDFLAGLPNIWITTATDEGTTVDRDPLTTEQIDEVTAKINEDLKGVEFREAVQLLRDYGVTDEEIVNNTGISLDELSTSLDNSAIKYSSIGFGIPVGSDNPGAIIAMYNTLELIGGTQDGDSGTKGLARPTTSFKVVSEGLTTTFLAAVDSRVVSGVYRDLRVGEYAKYGSTYNVKVRVSDSAFRYHTETINTIVYVKQFSGYYVEREIKNLQVHYEHLNTSTIKLNVYGDGEVNTDFSSIRFPMLRDAVKNIGFNDYQDLLEESMVIFVYSEQTVKMRFYQTMFFQFIMTAASLVSAGLLTPVSGATAAASSAAIATQTAVVVGVTVNLVIVVLEGMGAIDAKTAGFLRLAVALYSLGRGLSNPTSLGSDTAGATWNTLSAGEKAVTVLAIAEEVSAVATSATSIYLRDKAEDLQKMNKSIEEKAEEADKIYKELQDYVNTINPFNPSPERVYGYADRTMEGLIGQDIEDMIDMTTDVSFAIEHAADTSKTFQLEHIQV